MALHGTNHFSSYTKNYSIACSETEPGPDNFIVRGLWRAGEIVHYELNETVHIYHNGNLTEERSSSTLVEIDVAARLGSDAFVGIWRMKETNASMFGDKELDWHMYGYLSDGVVYQTNRYGGFENTRNMDELHDEFVRAVLFLDEQNHWINELSTRAQIQLYMDQPDLFEDVILRDMKFMFGLHGVQIYTDEVYTYDTWQENPWGPPVKSEGRLFVDSYDQENFLITIRNEVKLSEAETIETGITLSETQVYTIQARTGWPEKVLLTDHIERDEIQRVRTLEIIKIRI